MTPYEAYESAQKNGSSKELEDIIKEDACSSFYYARYVLKGPFPAGESKIANSFFYLFPYVREVLKVPFPAGENRIAKFSGTSYYYALDILKGPFPLGEQSIAAIDQFALNYQFRLNRDICSPEQLSEYPSYALSYAIMIGGRFPAGEPAMQKSPRIWRRYQEFLNDSL